MKRKRKKRLASLRIEPGDLKLLRKWRPRRINAPVSVSRPIDVSRKFMVGIAEVLAKVKTLGLKDVSRTTKLPAEIVQQILLKGNSPEYWPILWSGGARKNADPESVGYDGKAKKIRHLGPNNRSKKKSKIRSNQQPISTPVGGQPGYRIRYQFK